MWPEAGLAPRLARARSSPPPPDDRLFDQLRKLVRSVPWMAAYCAQLPRRQHRDRARHLILALADHFEPSIVPESGHGRYAERAEQERRVDSWCAEYPVAVGKWRDDEGWPLRHTYFYPGEQYDRGIIERLAEHCRAGWGEIEVHLHHGVEAPDTSENTRRALAEFRDQLGRHGCLSRWEGEGGLRYAFVHGNWALANSRGGEFCGVDDEMRILAETGCYADLTLPSAPCSAQVNKINALYECTRPLDQRAPHRSGRDLRVGRPPQTFPLIVQGPLGVTCSRRAGGWPRPCIENGAVSGRQEPSLKRLALWWGAGISVQRRPEWTFIKVHCHGMDPRDRSAMLGEPMQRFLAQLTERSNRCRPRLHFVTAREMVNMMLAACDGSDGDPGHYRDYRLRAVTPTTPP